jgi:Ca2+-binding RTX toxin-like protein
LFQDLAPATFTQNYVLHGTPFNETINVITAPASWCGVWLLPINYNGWAMQTHGEAGDDVIYGGGVATLQGNANWIFGDAGNDILHLGPGGAEANGGDGNDLIYGSDNRNDILIGGNGNDALCSHRTGITPLWQDGGDGTDSACAYDTGSCVHCVLMSIEIDSCLPCGPGY